MNELDELTHKYNEMFSDVFMKYPEYWFESDDTKKKVKVLKQCLKEKKLIKDVTSDFTEGVFFK